VRILFVIVVLAVWAAPARAWSPADDADLAAIEKRAPKLKLEVVGCDYFGENKPDDCRRQLSFMPLADTIAHVRGPRRKDEKVACTHWSHGFTCKYVTEMSQTTIEFDCTLRHACQLHYMASNDDEDTEVRYEIEPDHDRVRTWYAHRN